MLHNLQQLYPCPFKTNSLLPLTFSCVLDPLAPYFYHCLENGCGYCFPTTTLILTLWFWPSHATSVPHPPLAQILVYCHTLQDIDALIVCAGFFTYPMAFPPPFSHTLDSIFCINYGFCNNSLLPSIQGLKKYLWECKNNPVRWVKYCHSHL